MKPTFIALLALCLCLPLMGAEKKTDVEKHGYKGRVKSVKESYFIVEEKLALKLYVDRGYNRITEKEAFEKLSKALAGKNPVRSGAINHPTVTSKYDTKGNKVEEVSYDAFALKQNRTLKTIYKYNAKGNMVEEVAYLEGEILFKLLYKYDAKGNKVEKGWYGSNGKRTSKTIYNYDAKGNMGAKTVYHGGIYSRVTYKYDAKGNMVEKEEHVISNLSAKRVTYKYDAKGNKVESTDYDDNGKMCSKTIYKYDAKGNEVERTDYDDSGKISRIFKHSSPDYDQKGNKIKQTTIVPPRKRSSPFAREPFWDEPYRVEERTWEFTYWD